MFVAGSKQQFGMHRPDAHHANPGFTLGRKIHIHLDSNHRRLHIKGRSVDVNSTLLVKILVGLGVQRLLRIESRDQVIKENPQQLEGSVNGVPAACIAQLASTKSNGQREKQCLQTCVKFL